MMQSDKPWGFWSTCFHKSVKEPKTLKDEIMVLVKTSEIFTLNLICLDFFTRGGAQFDWE